MEVLVSSVTSMPIEKTARRHFTSLWIAHWTLKLYSIFELFYRNGLFLQVFGRKFWLHFPTYPLPLPPGADTEIKDVKLCGNFVHSDDSSVTVVTKATGLDSWRIEVRFPERNTFPFSQAFLGSKAGWRVALTTHPYLAPRINKE